MFGRKRASGRSQTNSAPKRRHGRRPPRSALTGPYLADPGARLARFELDARGAVEYLRGALTTELSGVQFGYQTAPTGEGESQSPQFYSIDRAKRAIVLYRMPIQRAKGLHVDDAEHRRFFTEHCVYRAVCEYLGREPWELMPGRFDHY